MTLTFQDYRSIFVVGSLSLMLLAASPALSLFIALPRSGEHFSELWLLGPDHMAEDYPFNVKIGESYKVYLGLANHMGEAKYYAVYLKFRNQTQPLPNATSSMPSPLLAFSELRALATEGETWEKPIVLSILQASSSGNSSSIDRLEINGYDSWVNTTAIWDSENNGFYYELFFELWLYNVSSQSFEFHDRFVGIWLNMTG
jgi:hypothetical protein